jgi:hypothetical protein
MIERNNGMVTNERKEPKIVAQAALILTLERAVESGSLSEELFRELTEQFGLEAAQELVCSRSDAFEERAEALRDQRDKGLVIFSDEFAKKVGAWPRWPGYFEG